MKTRAEKVAAIRAMQAQHPEWTHRQVADSLDMKLATLRNLLNDPDGAKQAARRKGYEGRCVDCGATTKSDGTSKPSQRCIPCGQAASVEWTWQRIVDAIRGFADRYGRPPTVTDFSPAAAIQTSRRVSAEKKAMYFERALRFYHDGCWPHAGTVIAKFGGWPAALQAAGFEANWRSYRYWTDDRILDAIRRHFETHGRAPTVKEWRIADGQHPNGSLVIERIGGWNRAIELAGLEPNGGSDVVWTEERIVAAVHAWAFTHGGQPPRSSDWRHASEDHPSFSTVIKRIGSWNQAIRAAGFRPRTSFGHLEPEAQEVAA